MVCVYAKEEVERERERVREREREREREGETEGGRENAIKRERGREGERDADLSRACMQLYHSSTRDIARTIIAHIRVYPKSSRQ